MADGWLNTFDAATINSLGGATVVATMPTTFGALPAPAAGNIGARAFITDSNTVVFNAIAAGSGANKVLVFSDGTNWRVG